MEQTVQTTTLPALRARRATRGERWAWYLYDFGNSAYAAVVLLAVYSAYFKNEVVGGPMGVRLWGIAIGIAMLVTGLLSPLLGTLADFTASKKKYLMIFSALAVVFTAMLFFVSKGDIFTGMLFFILAEIGYRGGQVFYNALLPDVANPEEMGRVSGNGWALGSLGGIICLVIVLAMIMLIKNQTVIHYAFLITAFFYAASALPLFLVLRERSKPKALPAGETYLSVGFRNLVRTWRSLGSYRQFAIFMLAFLIFNNAIMMTMDFAGIIGSTLFQMDQQQLIIFMMIVQITSVAGAFGFGKLAARITTKRALVISLFAMLAACTLIVVAGSLLSFFAIGALAGFALTGVQSVSRTAVGELAPEEKSAEFFGIQSLFQQISAFTGPLIYGNLAATFANMQIRAGAATLNAEQLGLRGAVSAMVLFLLAGLAILFFVRNWQQPVKPVPEKNG